jgi:hypothetical protein
MTCSIDVLEPSYQETLWLTFVREWVRASTGQSALDDLDERLKNGETISVPPEVEQPIQDVIDAMYWGSQISGGQVVPGVWEQGGKCFQDWTKTACFARYFMLQVPEKRTQLIQLIKEGNIDVWRNWPDDEPKLSPCTSGQSDDQSCCPSSVWADTAYLDLGREPEKITTDGWSTLSLIAAGVGVGLAAVLIKKNVFKKR